MKDQEFLDQEAVAIINKMTNSPFAMDGQLWLYWLFSLDLIPGGWTATIYLEDDYGKLEPKRRYTGFGDPSKAVKEAYAEIDKEWLEKGFAEGKVLNDDFDAYHKVDRKKWEYWGHFTRADEYWGHGFTETKLRKAREALWDDKEFWEDILSRHDGQNRTPDEMKEQSLTVYEHCMGNMTGMIMKCLVEKGVIKL